MERKIKKIRFIKNNKKNDLILFFVIKLDKYRSEKIMYIKELTNDRQSADLPDEYFIVGGTRDAIVRNRSTLALIIDEPCLSSCEYLYDCNVLTLNSSANRNDIETGPFIIIDYSSLSDENKLVAKKLEEEGKIKFGKDENGNISTCAITFPISEDSTIEEVDNLFKKIASEFKKQDILYGYYTEEELDDMILSALEKNQGYIEYNNSYMKYYDYLLVRISEGKLKGSADGECEIDGIIYRLSDVLENIKKSEFVQSQYTYDSEEGKYWLDGSLWDKHINYLNDQIILRFEDTKDEIDRNSSKSSKYEYGITDDIEGVIENAEEMIIPECREACKRLWDLNIETVECSNYNNSCLYISFDLTSNENYNTFRQMAEIDPRYFISDSTHSCTIAANSPEELEKLTEVFTIQDVKEKRYKTVDEFLIDYKTYPLDMDKYMDEFISDYGHVDPFQVKNNGVMGIKEEYKFRKSRIKSTLCEALSDTGMERLYVEDEGRIYNSPFYLKWHLKYLNQQKINQQSKK